MKFYCINEKCPKKIKGYAICTALMDVKDCLERKDAKRSDKPNEENGKGNNNISV